MLFGDIRFMFTIYRMSYYREMTYNEIVMYCIGFKKINFSDIPYFMNSTFM